LLFRNSWEQYRLNFKSALVFALLLAFVPAFSFFQNVYVSSGSIFIDYNLAQANPLELLAEAGLTALFLLFYSFFVSVIIFSVRKNLSPLKLQFYLHEMIRKFALRLFVFFLLFCLLLFLLMSALVALGAPLALAGIALLAISLLLMFVPQAVVVDEEGLRHALSSNFEFLSHSPRPFAITAVVGAALLAVLQLVEFALAQFTLLAPYVSLLIALVFIFPFLEVMKTYQYMMRFDLIKQHEIARRKKPLLFGPGPEDLAATRK
jgi:hypothetical protein